MNGIQELRQWSAEDLMGWETSFQPKNEDKSWISFDVNQRATYHCDYKDWCPDSLDAPAWQLMLVIDKMAKLGYFYTMNNHFYNGCKTEVFFHRNIPPTFEEQLQVQVATTLSIAILKAARITLEKKCI